MEIIDVLLILTASVAGIYLIAKGSDWSTDSLVPVAKKLGTSHIAIALIIVSIMVSLPEIVVALYASFLGHIEISIGVIIGSVIVNIGLMTGLSALITPLKISRKLILRDGIFAVCIAIMVLVLSSDLKITRAEGAAFILIFIPYLINVWEQEKAEHESQKKKELIDVEKELSLDLFGKVKAGFLTFVIGMVSLLIGSYLFSWSLIRISQVSGISDLLIGLTIGAIGPSIPNIVSAVQGTLKGIEYVAVSETLGSDIFTLLVTLGILSMIQPITLSTQWLRFDIPIMVGMSTLLLFFMIRKPFISRFEGFILLFSYIGILIANIFIHL
ncbi:MAG: calcium/sodium antiporter [Nanoarchaeota archaeon]